MRADLTDLSFPLVTFSKDGSIEIVRDLDALTTCTPTALKNGYYDGLRIVGIDGRQFVVKSARRLRTTKPWWRPPIVFFTQLAVTLDIEEAGTITLERLKGAILKAFKADRESWEEAIGYDDFAREVDKCQSFGELASYVCKF